MQVLEYALALELMIAANVMALLSLLLHYYHQETRRQRLQCIGQRVARFVAHLLELKSAVPRALATATRTGDQ